MQKTGAAVTCRCVQSLPASDLERSKDLDGDSTEHDSITLFDSAGNDSHSLSIEPSHDNNRNSLQSASP